MKISPVFLFTITFLPFITACWTPQKTYWDAEVDRLCAIDGGIRVYETVTLLPDKFNKWGQINFYRPTQGENTLGPEYIYKWDIYYYKKGHPVSVGAHETAMRRDHARIIRKSDMKLMGEMVKYHRAGGDLPGPWMPSSYHCPGALEANEGVLMNQIFIKSVEERGNEQSK
ncbi:MAG: hypothetical protein KF888_09160 [Nitrosomonas sp.]|nr:hypothetical protein [Nitrosomonas sp.]